MYRHEFRYLFPKEELSVDALEWAEALKTRFQQARDEIQERVGEDRDAFNEELGKLYDSYRAEINELFPTPEERFEGAAALWYTQHTRPEMECLRHATRTASSGLSGIGRANGYHLCPSAWL